MENKHVSLLDNVTGTLGAFIDYLNELKVLPLTESTVSSIDVAINCISNVITEFKRK